MIKLEEFLMSRDKEYPLSIEQALNAAKTLAAINYIRGRYGKPMKCSSGYRPGHYNKNAGGANNSAHLTCEAIDIEDLDGSFAKWCLANLKELEKAGLYMEDPASTPNWVHLQTRLPKSGNRIFIP
jgi:uncharacterized protein YcbK (DUF882 family)